LKVLGINKGEGQYAQKTVTEEQRRLPFGEFRRCCVKDLCKLSIHSISWGWWWGKPSKLSNFWISEYNDFHQRSKQ